MMRKSGRLSPVTAKSRRVLYRSEQSPTSEIPWPPESVWTTTITIFEIRFGLALLTPGRRRDRLDEAFDRAIDEILGGRVLPFDRSAAEAAAAIAARQRQIGRPVEKRDVQIAGIAAARKATLATRNARHFESLGIILVDPWRA
jgi:toxin FitB